MPNNYALLPTEDRPTGGVGITRTDDPRATLWPYEVRFQMGSPMSGTIAAIDRHQAARFLKARYPQAASCRVLPRR
jgi:hypothetical protein